eukprot:1331174-Alexandrium_andersonii.AAC.1
MNGLIDAIGMFCSGVYGWAMITWETYMEGDLRGDDEHGRGRARVRGDLQDRREGDWSAFLLLRSTHVGLLRAAAGGVRLRRGGFADGQSDPHGDPLRRDAGLAG